MADQDQDDQEDQFDEKMAWWLRKSSSSGPDSDSSRLYSVVQELTNKEKAELVPKLLAFCENRRKFAQEVEFARQASPSSSDSSSRPSSLVQELTDEEKAELVPKMLEFCENRRKFAQEEFAWDPELMKPISDNLMDKMYKKMRCQDCNGYPSPDGRHQCDRGHFFCKSCFDIRGKDKICGFNMHPMDIRIVGNRHGQLPEKKSGLTDKHILKVEEEEKAGQCLRVVKHQVKDDPFYTAMFNNSVWRCSFCANNGFLGSDIFEHMENCSGFQQQLVTSNLIDKWSQKVTSSEDS